MILFISDEQLDYDHDYDDDSNSFNYTEDHQDMFGHQNVHQDTVHHQNGFYESPVQQIKCQIVNSKILTKSGWKLIDQNNLNHRLFELFIDNNNKSYLQWFGSESFRSELQQKLVLIELTCQSTTTTQSATTIQSHLMNQSHNTTGIRKCIGIRIGWVPGVIHHHIQSKNGQNNYLIIGLCLGILGLMYVLSLMIYIKTKKEQFKQLQKRLKNDSEDNKTTSSSLPLTSSPSAPSSPASHGSNEVETNDNYENRFLDEISIFCGDNQSKIHIQNGHSPLGPEEKQGSRDLGSRELSRDQLSRDQLSRNQLGGQLVDDSRDVKEQEIKIDWIKNDMKLQLMTAERIQKKLLHVNPEYFDLDLMHSPPESALEFLERIREMITIAKSRIRNFRYRPSLVVIPEDDYFYDENLNPDQQNARPQDARKDVITKTEESLQNSIDRVSKKIDSLKKLKEEAENLKCEEDKDNDDEICDRMSKFDEFRMELVKKLENQAEKICKNSNGSDGSEHDNLDKTNLKLSKKELMKKDDYLKDERMKNHKFGERKQDQKEDHKKEDYKKYQRKENHMRNDRMEGYKMDSYTVDHKTADRKIDHQFDHKNDGRISQEDNSNDLCLLENEFPLDSLKLPSAKMISNKINSLITNINNSLFSLISGTKEQLHHQHKVNDLIKQLKSKSLGKQFNLKQIKIRPKLGENWVLQRNYQLNGGSGNGNGIKQNGIKLNRVKLNGTSLSNGISGNAISLNAISLNGIPTNGIPTNGIKPNRNLDSDGWSLTSEMSSTSSKPNSIESSDITEDSLNLCSKDITINFSDNEDDADGGLQEVVNPIDECLKVLSQASIDETSVGGNKTVDRSTKGLSTLNKIKSENWSHICHDPSSISHGKKNSHNLRSDNSSDSRSDSRNDNLKNFKYVNPTGTMVIRGNEDSYSNLLNMINQTKRSRMMGYQTPTPGITVSASASPTSLTSSQTSKNDTKELDCVSKKFYQSSTHQQLHQQHEQLLRHQNHSPRHQSASHQNSHKHKHHQRSQSLGSNLIHTNEAIINLHSDIDDDNNQDDSPSSLPPILFHQHDCSMSPRSPMREDNNNKSPRNRSHKVESNGTELKEIKIKLMENGIKTMENGIKSLDGTKTLNNGTCKQHVIKHKNSHHQQISQSINSQSQRVKSSLNNYHQKKLADLKNELNNHSKFKTESTVIQVDQVNDKHFVTRIPV